MLTTSRAAADVDAIRMVTLAYARAIDARDWVSARECFHPDAVVAAPNWSGRAHEEYAERLNGTSHTDLSQWTELTAHYVVNTIVEIERRGVARAESRCLANHRTSLPLGELPLSFVGDLEVFPDGPKDVLVGLRYLDRFTRRSGRWRIAARTIAMDWSRVDHVMVQLAPDRAR